MVFEDITAVFIFAHALHHFHSHLLCTFSFARFFSICSGLKLYPLSFLLHIFSLLIFPACFLFFLSSNLVGL